MDSELDWTIGVDEVGVGTVYGPLVVAAVANLRDWYHPEVRDSKTIKNEKKRQQLATLIQENCLWATAVVDVHLINTQGAKVALEQGTFGVARALATRLKQIDPNHPIVVTVDGEAFDDMQTPEYRLINIPRADATVFEVSCASIVAKVLHDNLIRQQVEQNSQLGVYDLNSNKGYGVPKHFAALARYGLSPGHRVEACRTLLSNRRYANYVQRRNIIA